MSTYKRIDGDYVITTVNSGDFVTVETHTMEVIGNLNVRGNLTYIEVSELKVDDPFITVAANNSGSGNAAVFPNQGLVAQTGTGTFAGLRFHNDTGEWQISPDVAADGTPITSYQPIGIATAGLPGGPVDSIQFNAGSNLFNGVEGFKIDNVNSSLNLDAAMSFGNIGTAPSVRSNAVAVYHNELGSGGTGLYVKSAIIEDELVSKTKAIVFGIIF
jgi:hypothetical protein